MQSMQLLPSPGAYTKTTSSNANSNTPHRTSSEAPYCASEALSTFTCFHSHSRPDHQVDSLCIGHGADLQEATKKFHLDCPLRTLAKEETDAGLIPFNKIRGYWYETGPAQILSRAVDLNKYVPPPAKEDEKATAKRQDDAPPPGDAVAEEPSPSVTPQSGSTPSALAYPKRPPPKNFLLLKREGETNPWHCLMEIYSSYMAIDVLRMSRDQENKLFFRAPEDVNDTQVVILDEREDGPYFDLWTLFAANRRPLRMKELLADPAAVDAARDANIIIPLAGGSNPLWQDDADVQQCSSAPTLSVFARRVLGFYEIPDPPPRKRDDPIVVTYVDRRETRRIVGHEPMLAALRERVPHIRVQSVDFAALTFAEQLRTVRETDVLVGVHGAGLTHVMFMRENVGAIVEIQPGTMTHAGFRNVAAMRGLGYFHVHAQAVNPVNDPGRRHVDDGFREVKDGGHLEKRDNWHTQDIVIEEARFVDVVEAAVRSMYSKGNWNYDVNVRSG
ncbi:hypothetical protein VD0004_g9793 [Verticillium dahliae]|nr:hypothetical protein VD0004_g9793 [Verticillium dahliae]PNH61631.1 hypothetical protein VD0001_g9656 [Verticillium dahliae]